MNLIVIYVGRPSSNNLKHGLDNKIWGFKESAVADLRNYNKPDTYVLFAYGYTGGSPRVNEIDWNKYSIDQIVLARITTPISKESTIEWEDEKFLEEEERYIWRFNFNDLKYFQNIKLNNLHNKVSENIRLSATTQSRGKLIENIEMKDIGLEYSVNHNEKKLDSLSIINKNENISVKINQKTKIDSLKIEKFMEEIYESGYIYSNLLIKRFICLLLTKPFVLLTGLSGSGKTKLAQAFAEWISESDEQVCLIPVGADWINREPILGYPNALEQNKYVKPDNGVLDLLINANKEENKYKPYFLILDEMNLSHVERYFADFLSVMESDKYITIHSYKECKDQNGQPIPGKIYLSNNIFIIGTVNIDETTYMFSPKVLDRAGVIEFKVTHDDIDDFTENPVKGDISKIKNSGANMANDFVEKTNNKEDNNFDKVFTKVLLDFFDELKKVGAEFGYRTISEIYQYINKVKLLEKESNSDKWENDTIIDTIVIQKLLPKLHGSRRKLEPVLKSIAKLCLNEYIDVEAKLKSEIKSDYSNDIEVKYKISYEKIQRMYIRLLNDGFTSFAEA